MTTQCGYRYGRARRRAVCLALSVLVAAFAGCTSVRESLSSSSRDARLGGTLRLAVEGFSSGLDPQSEDAFSEAELFRCCLARTLYTYPGVATAEGGAVLRPDLAAAMPTVSQDGLTWTIRLKTGLRYAPPYDDIEITTGDFIRALERTARTGNASYHSGIEGFDAFAAGEADSIVGLEAPDDQTLRIRLTRPSGDLAARLSLPYATPIPPSASGARLGAVTDLGGEYGPFLASSGPYMYEGSEDVDLATTPDERVAADGYDLPRSLTLVRNPSWDPASDPLRKAYADRIEFLAMGDSESLRAVEKGDVDVSLAEVPPTEVERFEHRLEVRDRLHFNDTNGTVYLSFNLALPPLDDVHVRRAINFVIDKASIANTARKQQGFGTSGVPAGHLLPDSFVNNLLVDYDPYGSAGARGDLASAKREMALSKYDEDGDGRCDGPVCDGLRFPTTEYFPRIAEDIGRDLKQLGMGVSVDEVDVARYFGEMTDPGAHNHLFINAWFTDYLSSSTFMIPLFSGASIAERGNLNHSLLGAHSGQLRRWGYSITEVPTIDDVSEECLALVGASQVPCWAEADQVLMENMVPLAPLIRTTGAFLVSDRVTSFSYAQFSASPALDRIAVK
jgi:peptide/nickel transport system substrate-binding protein